MVEVPKDKLADKTLPENNSVIMSSPQIDVDDIVIEHTQPEEGGAASEPVVRTQRKDPIAEIRANQASAERALEAERERSKNLERELAASRSQVDSTKANLIKSENEKITAQESAVINRIEAAKIAVENAERALEEAIDTGRPAKEQITLQKKLAEAVYTQRGAESAKEHFDRWKENQKNKPVEQPVRTSQYSDVAQKWIDARPLFKRDKNYMRVATGAALDAQNSGIQADTDAYFKAIEEGLREAGFDPNPHHDTDIESAPIPVRKRASGTSTAAPVNHDSTGAGARGGNAAEEQRTGRRTFKLDGNMREQALKIYGKNSQFKLSDDEAYKRYAARQLEIRDKRANGEKI